MAQKVVLSDLSHEDVLFPCLFPYLSHRDWLSLRCVNKQFERLLATFFQFNRVIRSSNLTEQEFRILTAAAENLRILVIPNMMWLTDELLKPVLQRNRKLVHLNLNGCRNLTQGSLQVVTVSCHRLERLHLAGCGWVRPEALEYHAQHHFRLLSNRMHSGKLISPQDALAVMGKIGLRTKIEERKKSRYKGKADLHSQLVHEPRVIKIKNHRRQLWRTAHLLRVDISGNDDITDTALGIFLAVFHKIVYLNIGFISNLTDETMKSIAQRLKNLQFLDISGSSFITDKGVFTVAKHCQKLARIVLGGSGITESVRLFLKHRGISCEDVLDPELALEGKTRGTPPCQRVAFSAAYHVDSAGDPVPGPSRPSKTAKPGPSPPPPFSSDAETASTQSDVQQITPFSNLLSMD